MTITPQQLYDLREHVIGWSRRALARKLQCAEATIRQMEDARQRIPEPVSDYVEGIARAVSTIPPPLPDWKGRP